VSFWLWLSVRFVSIRRRTAGAGSRLSCVNRSTRLCTFSGVCAFTECVCLHWVLVLGYFILFLVALCLLLATLGCVSFRICSFSLLFVMIPVVTCYHDIVCRPFSCFLFLVPSVLLVISKIVLVGTHFVGRLGVFCFYPCSVPGLVVLSVFRVCSCRFVVFSCCSSRCCVVRFGCVFVCFFVLFCVCSVINVSSCLCVCACFL